MNLVLTTWLVLLLAGCPGQGAEVATLTAGLDRALAAREFAGLEAALQTVAAGGWSREAVGVIRGRLHDHDSAVRRRAAYALSQVDREEAKRELAGLVEALGDDEPRVRARVALALARIGPASREAVPALLGQLHDPDPRARAGAARALGAIGAEADTVVPRVTGLLRDPEAVVRGMAAMVLGQFGPAARAAVPVLRALGKDDRDADVRAAAVAAVEAIDPSLPVLQEALAATDADRRLWAVCLLAKSGPEARAATPQLAAALAHDEAAAVRAGAAFALGRIGPAARHTGPGLVAALTDPAANVRAAAALALGLLGPGTPGAGVALAEALKDGHAEDAAAAATALGNLGADAEAAVPVLVDLARGTDPTLRRRAVDVLARIGPAARSAAPVLLEVLRAADPLLRRDAARGLVCAGPQAGAPVAALVEALRHTGDHADRPVRAWACLSLAAIGPRARAAVPDLIAALRDDEVNVRASAGLALARIGPPAVAELVAALGHLDPRVRTEAARALGGMGAGAWRALDRLRAALRDEDPDVGLAAGEAVARIALGFQLAQDTAALGRLAAALADLHAARSSPMAAGHRARWAAVVDQVRGAVRALRTVERASLFDRVLHSVWFAWVAGPLLGAAACCAAWTVLLVLRPLWLLWVNDTLRRLPHLTLPGPLGGVQVSLRGLLLLGPFAGHRRVLDAWVARHAEALRAAYAAQAAVHERPVYVPAPVLLDGRVIALPTAADLGQVFGPRRGCLLIAGEGGAGKTALACQLGRWALAADRAERLCAHLMVPVLIDQGPDREAGEGRPAYQPLTEAVRGRLQALTGGAAGCPEDLLDHLLRRRRILVVVDRFSEAGPAARAAVCPGQADFPAHALVVVSRDDEALDGVPKSVVRPLRIEGNRLASFLEEYLVRRGKRPLFDDAAFFQACRGLALRAGARPITALLALQYAEQMIARKESRLGGSQARAA